MKLREYTAADYEMASGWWKGHGWTPPPENILPKLGVVVEHEGMALAVSWLYMDNSTPVCWLEWLVTNPKANALLSIRAVSQLITFMTERALELDYGVMMTTCRQPALARLYERNGFIKTDEGVIHLFRVIQEGK